ncbi:MAG: DUF3857 domain-containing protein, partial [Myxococcota bacterium]
FGIDPERQVPYARLRRLRRVKVLRASGRRLSRVEVRYDPGAIVRGLSARAVLPSGEIRKAEQGIQDIVQADGVAAKALRISDVEVGTIIEHTYDLYADDLRFLPPWRFSGPFPTIRAEYVVSVPANFEIDLRFSENGQFVDRPPERFELDGATRYSWTLSNLPPQFTEDGMPAPELLAPRAHVLFKKATLPQRTVSGFDSWDAVARWQQQRIPGWTALSDATVREARRIAGEGSPSEKALKLAEVLARDFKNGPTSDIPLWRAPAEHPDRVFAAKTSNPTTRGMLLVALLRAIGIEADPALFAYRDRDALIPDAPLVRALDGVAAIVSQSDGPMIIDPNQATLSAQVPSPRLQGTRIVAVRNDGAEVMRVPRSTADQSRCDIDFRTKWTAKDGVFGTVDVRLTGAEAGALRADLLAASAGDYAAIVGRFLHSRGFALPIESISIADLRALHRPLSLKGRVASTDAIRVEASQLLIRTGAFIGWPSTPVRQTRRTPLLLGPARQVRVRGSLSMPEGHAPQILPPAAEHTYDGVHVQWAARKENDRRIGFARSERWTKPSIPRSRYERFAAFLEAVMDGEEQAISVARPTERPLEF